MLIPEKAVLGVFCGYHLYNRKNSDQQAFTTHSGHFWLKMLNWTAFPPECQDLTWFILSSHHNPYHM